ncbi:MAG: PqqD family protein [Verrucomicrobia bacterium]|nr:MAG: PqqD family protein [Verrucomicrobiota bacterium]
MEAASGRPADVLPMHNQTRFKINSPAVMLEKFDDEVVMVNLASGTYYSLGKSGAVICTAIASGATTTTITDALSRQFQGSPEAMEQAVSGFIDELLREQIVVPVDPSAPEEPEANGSVPAGDSQVVRRIFEVPVLEKYTDMQELFLLDPVHEVGDSGWPQRKA